MSSLLTSAAAMAVLSALGPLMQCIPWHMLLLPLQLLGLHHYLLHDREICLRLQRKLRWSSHTTDTNKPCGYSIGSSYILYLEVSPSDEGDQYSGWLFGTPAAFNALTTADVPAPPAPLEEGETAPPQRSSICIYTRGGSYYSVWFRKRTVTIDSVQPRPQQLALIEQIEATFKKQRHCVAYIHGPPGSGKSMLGPLLAIRLNAAYCNTLKPWQPGDTLAELYGEAETSHEKPLIVSFDEIDTALLRIHGGIEAHKSLTTLITDKSSWNHFMDEIARGMYPNLIILLTTNRAPEFIRELDPSYIRPGRIDLELELPLASLEN